MDDRTRAELERRLRLLETPDSGEGALPPLPLADVVAAVVGLGVLTLVLLWWAL